MLLLTDDVRVQRPKVGEGMALAQSVCNRVCSGVPEGADAAEVHRLQTLGAYKIMHTFEEAEYDELAELAADLTGAPMAGVSLLTANEQWFKARFGVSVTAIPREYAFCTHTLTHPHQPLVVCDASRDPRFRDNPFVTGPQHVRAYLGVALKAPNDAALGTLAVLDVRPRRWTATQIRRMSSLGRMTEAQLELRRALMP